MRTIVITGASSGIGAQAARHLARSHPEDRLILIGRNPDRTKRVAAEVGAELRAALARVPDGAGRSGPDKTLRG